MGPSGAVSPNRAGSVRFGIFEFHPETLELKRSGQPVRLQDLPARLLALLVRHPGELVSRDRLRSELWPSDTYVQFDAGLNTAMNKLRLALRDSAENPRFIRTVPRSGYQFIAPVSVAGLAPATVTTMMPLEQQPAAEPPLEAPRQEPSRNDAPPRDVQKPRLVRRARIMLSVAVVAALAAVIAWVALRSRDAGYGPTVRFAIDLPQGQTFQYYSGRQIAISPDGSTVAWIGASGGVRQIYARRLEDNSFRSLGETAGASGLTFSPAGDWVAYISEAGELRKASIDGRSNRKLYTLGPRSIDGTLLWGRDGWIYFSANDYPPSKAGDFRNIFRIRPDGGKPESLIAEPLPVGTWYPSQLVGHGLMATAHYAPTDDAVSYIDLSDRKVRQLVANASNGLYLPSGHLIFDRSGVLMAAPFDTAHMEVTGSPVAVASDVAPDRYAGLQVDVSETGTLVYFRGSVMHPRQPVWVDREGRETPTGLPVGRYRLLDLSSDGERLLLTRYESGDQWKIYSYGLSDRSWKEIHADNSPGSGAIWSPDGQAVAIAARYEQERMDTVYVKPLDGSFAPRPLLGNAFNGKYPQSWSGPANAILYAEGYHDATKRDIYALSMASGAQPQCVSCSPEDDIFPSFSPDGRWISYTSLVSGGPEIYVQAYPMASPGKPRPIRITSEGGGNSVWAPSGREICYWVRNQLWAVAFDPNAGKVGQPRKLFAGRYEAGRTAWNRDYVISRDGSRFLVLKTVDDPPDYRQIQVVVNWFRELRDRPG